MVKAAASLTTYEKRSRDLPSLEAFTVTTSEKTPGAGPVAHTILREAAVVSGVHENPNGGPHYNPISWGRLG